MTDKRTRSFTRRSDAMIMPDYRNRRTKELKGLARPLTSEEISKLRRLLNGGDY
ncbi:MAG: hypothetical protein HC907_36685 [Richelia sp. SM1_7_0]|nr:hypothetical protein [Richelia sp. SM1_7_0]